MRRLRSRLVGAAAAAGLACAGLAAGASPAAAAACSGSTGITVVIDNGSSTSIRCHPGGGTAADALLAVASVEWVATQQGFVCRIDGYPSKAADACVGTPPASAYWAFFHASRGGSWTYSSQGVRSYYPPAGSVIGFAFGSGGQPGAAPPAPTATSTPKATASTRTPTSSPRTTTSSPKSTGGTTSSGGTSTGGGSTSSGTRSGTAGSTATTSSSGKATKKPTATKSATGSTTPTSSAAPDATASASGTPSDPPGTLAAEPTSATGSGGTGTLLVAAVLVALLAGGAGWFAWRRRTTE